MNATHDVFRTKPHADRLPLGHNFKLLTDIDAVEPQRSYFFAPWSSTVEVQPKKGKPVEVKIVGNSPEEVRSRMQMIKLVETEEDRARRTLRSRRFTREVRTNIAHSFKESARLARETLIWNGINLPE